MNKNIKIIIIGISVILAITAIGILAFYQHQFSAPQRGAETETIVVNLTTTEAELIPKLKEQGYIRSEWAFNYVLKKKDWQDKIQPGAYKVSKAMNAWQLAEVLVSEPYMKWVVIPEGLRKEQIAELIGNTLGWNQETKRKWVGNYTAMKYDEIEGVYFPDTYLIPTDETPLQVADRLRAKFNEKFQPYAEKFLEANIKWTTALKIASLVQREADSKADMPLIAGIIWNRLLYDPPMKLEIDATVQYARDSVAHYGKELNDVQLSGYSGEGDWWTPIKIEDKQIESPYNTYLNKGLPPHPICNPGLDAIDAVLNSEETECLYYLHDSSGQIHCSKTYEEHKENIEKYLKSSSESQSSKNSPIKPFGKELSEDEIWGDLVYCTTACNGTWNYCSLEPTEERTRKLRLRNLYNNNTIECYIDKRHTLLAAGSPALINVTREVFEEIKGSGIGKDGIGIKDLGWIE